MGDSAFVDLITYNSTGHFSADTNCPLLGWEPSGSDFLSPCLQEADLMSRFRPASWIQLFQPEMFEEDFDLAPGRVIDRTDGHLVHLDGVNFSRAWNLYNLVIVLPPSMQATR